MSNTGFNQVFGSFGTTGFGNGFSYKTVAPVVNDYRVLYYDLSNTDSYPGGGVSVYDLEGSSDATLINSPEYSSGSLTFNGIDQYLETNTDLSSRVPTSVTTISMWVYPMDNGVLLSERGSDGYTSFWHDSQIEMVDGLARFGVWSYADGTAPITSDIPTPLNNWYNLVLAYDGSTLYAYVNGRPSGHATYSRVIPGNFGQGLRYTIAASDSTDMGNGGFANIKLGEFQVYNSALSSSTVLDKFNSARSRYGAPPSGYVAGIKSDRYTQGYFADDMTWFDEKVPTTTEYPVDVIEDPSSDDGSFFSRRWTGYFRAPETGDYIFYLSSDDASYMWLGQYALSGWSAENAIVDNGGLHGNNEVQSSPVSLQAGQLYPIQVFFGENGGGDILTFSYSTDTTSKTTDLTGLIFYNFDATDGRGF